MLRSSAWEEIMQKIKVLFGLLCIVLLTKTVFAKDDADTTQAHSCSDELYAKAHGKNATELFALSRNLFDYTDAARRAASRNRLNWNGLPQSGRDAYIKKLREIAQSKVIPGLVTELASKPLVKRGYRKNGSLVILFQSGSSITVTTSCIITDGSAYGVSLSTLAAEALKDPSH